MSEKRARYIVGIDLGTTHTVVGVCDTLRAHEAEAGAQSAQTRPRITVFQIPQLVAPGEVLARPLLPSFRYHPAPEELSESARNLGFAEPSPELPVGLVGTLAQQLGGKTHGRLVSSAKSWLCHPGVDREAAILPWGASEDVPKISPVAASEAYLAHVRAAWNAAHPKHPLEHQDVVLTVPASFDEAARALTLRAARRAGLQELRLLEEPQAAFYDYLDRHRDTLSADLAGVHLALVVDVGGGTTDLTLIQVELRETGPRLTRIAVGEHLMLGGDNMDLTLARVAEAELSGTGDKLTAARFAQLVEQCRGVKERLLGEAPPERMGVSLLGQGSKLISGTRSMQLTRERVEALVVDGFVPHARADERVQGRKTALMEFGLPYAADPAISRHVAQFLARHRGVAAEALSMTPAAAEAEPARAMPDAVLFNGGVFKSAALKGRLSSVLAAFRGAALKELDNDEPELAVARGAVAYGLSRRGVGLRIGGGSPRSYHLALEETGEEKRAICVLPRGAEEGEELTLKQRAFMLRVGAPARFRVLTCTHDTPYRLGELVALDGRFHELPDVAAVLEARPGDGQELAVELHTSLTEVGTLEMSFVARDDVQRRYKLEFDLRQRTGQAEAPARRVTQLHPRFAEAKELISAFFGKAAKELEGKKIKSLRQDLEKILGPRESWDTALLRELFGALLTGKKARRRSADHERIWLHLAGYCLRPGLGYPLDSFRVEQTFALYQEGVQFAPDAQVWSQWWILWRRIAGGLNEAQQTRILADLTYYLEPQGPRPRKRPQGPKALGLEDMVRLAGALERIDVAKKAELGQWMWKRLEKTEVSQASALFCIGRLGARVPLHGSLHSVVPRHVVEPWLTRVLALDLAKFDEAAVAAAQLARFSQDRERDVPDALRERTAEALERARENAGLARIVREGGELTVQEESRVFGESLPPGLRLLDSDDGATPPQ